MTPIYRRIIIFFASAIAIGAVLLSAPFSLTDKVNLPPFPDLLLRGVFTATSAVCVTGLTVVDIGSYYNHFGQIVILALIQVGALGYILFATASGMLIGRLPITERLAIKEVVEPSTYEGLLSLLKHIIKIVVAVELLGAAVLSFLFGRYFSFLQAVYYGIFHSVSAFANAGFSLFPTNLEIFKKDIYIMSVIALLIVVGGIGFLVLSEIIPSRLSASELPKEDSGEKNKPLPRRLTLHTKMALYTSAILIFSGAILFLLFENSNVSFSSSGLPSPIASESMSAGYKVANAFFMSITSRTAGFNTIKVNLLMPATIFMIMILMFIGASPGGTGGGVKTTTAGVAVLWLVAFIRGKNEVNLGGRRIPFEVARKAISYILLGLAYCTLAIVAVLFFEKNNINPLWVCFEVTSAFGTVGLSAGITPQLAALSKIVLIITMLVGRVGLLTLALSAVGAVSNGKKELIQYPEERVLVG